MHNGVQWGVKDSVVSSPLGKIDMAFKIIGEA